MFLSPTLQHSQVYICSFFVQFSYDISKYEIIYPWLSADCVSRLRTRGGSRRNECRILTTHTETLCNSMPLGAAWAYFIKVLVLASTAS